MPPPGWDELGVGRHRATERGRTLRRLRAAEFQRVRLQVGATVGAGFAPGHQETPNKGAQEALLREPRFPKAFWQEIFKRVQSLGASGDFETLITLAPILPEPFISKALRVALDYALADVELESRRKLLATLAPELNEPLLRRALNAVRTIEDKEQQALELAWLTPHSAKRTLRRILKSSSENEERRQLDTATRLARNFVTLGCSREALETILTIEDDWQQFLALLTVTPHLSKPVQRRALRLLWDYVGPDDAEDLSAYLPFVPERAIREILQIAWAMDRRWLNDTALMKVTLEVAGTGHAATALAVAPLIGDAEKRDRLLKTLAIRLIGSGFPGRALDAVRDVYDEGERVATLEILLPLLPQGMLPEALSTVRAIRGERYKATGLAALVPHLPEILLLEALKLARYILWPVARAEAFTGLLPFLPSSLKVEIGRETEELIQAIPHEELRHEVAVKLASVASVNRKPTDASGRAKTGQRDGERGLSSKRVLRDLLNKVRAIDNGEARIEGLRAIALDLIRTGKPSIALALAWEVKNVGERALILDKLIPYFGKFPSSAIYQQWHERLKAQANRTRRGLLAETYTLVAPFIHANGANMRAEIASAIRDVGRWWR